MNSSDTITAVIVLLLVLCDRYSMNPILGEHDTNHPVQLVSGVRKLEIGRDNKSHFKIMNPSGIPLAGVISLPVEDNQYVQLPTGNPGKFNKYRIDYSLNTTYLYDFPSSYSQTYNAHSEIIYFGDIKLRLSVRYGAPPTNYDARIYGVKHDGVLALGPGSEIWKYWHIGTFSSSRIDLGRFNLNSYTKDSPGIMINYFESIQCTIDDRSYTVRFDPRQDISYLPHELYHKKSFDIIHEYNIEDCYKWCDRMRFPVEGIASMCSGSSGDGSDSTHSSSRVSTLSISDIDYASPTQSKHTIPSSKINTVHPQEIVLGRLFMDKMVIYIDNISQSMIIIPSFSRFRETHPDCNTNTYFALGICVTYIVWVLTVNSETPNVENNRIFFILLQLFGSILVFCTFSYNLYGIEIWKFYCHLVDSNITWLYDIGTIIVPVFTVLNIISVTNVFRKAKNYFVSAGETTLEFKQGFSILSRWECSGLTNRLFFETTILWSLWITLLEGHYDAGGVLYLIFVSTVLCCLHLVITLMLFVRDSLMWVPSCLLFIFSFVFLLHSNVLPYITLQMFQNPFKWEFATTYVSIFVFIPSLFILVHIERALLFCKSTLSQFARTKKY